MELQEPIDLETINRLLKEPIASVDKRTKGQLGYLKKAILHNVCEPIKVRYDYAENVRALKIGRLYPCSGSLTWLPKRIREVFANGMHSLDIVNCHYTIALKIATEKGLPRDAIEDYVLNRDARLQSVMDTHGKTRDEAKEVYLKCVMGGRLDIKDEFLDSLKLEIEVLAIKMWQEHPEWHHIKFKKDPKYPTLSDHEHKIYSCLSYVFHTEETEIMMLIMKRLEELGNPAVVYIFDGVYTKMSAECMELETYVYEHTRYNLKLKYETIVSDYVFTSKQKEEDKEEYSIIEFAQKHFMLLGDLYIESKGRYGRPEQIRSASSYCQQFGKKYWQNVQLNMPPERVYERFDFMPYNKDNLYDPHAYNLFKGFQFEQYFPEFEGFTNWDDYCQQIAGSLTADETAIFNNSMTFKQLSEYLCNGNAHSLMYVLQYMARIIRQPSYRIGKMLIFRNNVGGTGKTAFFNKLFIQQVVGRQYGSTHSSLSEVFGEKNMNIENKLLLVLEESDITKTKTLQGDIKEAVDRDMNTVRLLYHNPYTTQNTVNYILNTNKDIGIVFERDNMRRFPVFDAKEHRLTQAERRQLQCETSSPDFVKIFVKCLCRTYDEDFDFELFPKSETVDMLQEVTMHPVDQFIRFLFVEWSDYERDTIVSPKGTVYNWHNEEPPGEARKVVKDFEHSLQEIYDIYKKFSAIRMPNRKVLEFTSLKNSNEWKQFKQKYNIKAVKGIYKINYKELRKRMTEKNTITCHFQVEEAEPASKRQRTDDE